MLHPENRFTLLGRPGAIARRSSEPMIWDGVGEESSPRGFPEGCFYSLHDGLRIWRWATSRRICRLGRWVLTLAPRMPSGCRRTGRGWAPRPAFSLRTAAVTVLRLWVTPCSVTVPRLWATPCVASGQARILRTRERDWASRPDASPGAGTPWRLCDRPCRG